MESNDFDDVSGHSLYGKIIQEIKSSVIVNDLNSFKILTALLNYANNHKNWESERHCQQIAYESTGNINLITLACRSCAEDVLRHLFSDENFFYCVPFPTDKSELLPEDDDDQHHNAFYYAIRSNNSVLLEILIEKWPNDCLKENTNKLDDILSKAYKDLVTKNVYICKSMELCVFKKLVDLRFFQQTTVHKKTVVDRDEEQNLKDLAMIRIDFVINEISYVREHFWSSEINELFIHSAEYIAKNIHTLKAVIKSAHKLLWEEIEFCLLIFVRSCRGRFQKYPLYNFLLNKQRTLTHLQNFSCVLIAVKEQVKSGKVNKFRKIVIEGIENLDKNPDFNALIDDFTQVRDLYSLQTIRKSTTISASADVSEKNGQFLLIRALQIIGEHFKNTLDSPKLSNATYELVLSEGPENVKEIITDLRNCLSHAESLSLRPENEENVISFFESIQSDVKLLDMIIYDILCRKKAAVIGKMFDKIKECENSSCVKLLLEKNHFSPSTFKKEIEEIGDLNIGYIEDFEKQIVEFQTLLEKQFSSTEHLFHKLHDVVFNEDSQKASEFFKQLDVYECFLPKDQKETIKVYTDFIFNLPAAETETIPQELLLKAQTIWFEKFCDTIKGIYVKLRLKTMKSSLLRIRDCSNSSEIDKLQTQIQELEDEDPISEEEITKCKTAVSKLELFSSDIIHRTEENFI